ncbi:TetR family transcriptional regulator [Brevibacterium ammoniilyticum]|uniref:TetR/AcrR family transcriptional regulator n=1 Tax=Brevibacterium ammoniilyticum TaxID=1046555 RepID=UPI0031387A15
MSDPAPRRRGRPPKSSRGDAREAIAKAAASEFAERGYDAASMRGIARRAGVDPSLVHHYFDSKAALFAEAVRLPVRPDRIVRRALDAPLNRLGESIVTTVLTAWENPKVRPIGITLLKTAIGGSGAGGLLRQFMVRELGRAIAGRLETEGIDPAEADLRATLVMSQMAGVLIVRHVIGIEPLASEPIAEVIARVSVSVQGHLDGRL